MLVCDHLFYTTAAIGSKSGYQVIAKSAGITHETIQELEGYLYPTGIDPSNFVKSKSLLFLKNAKIAFSIVKNIGLGFDGRDNTLYTHTIILDEEQFRTINYDSRILFNYFIENPTERGTLEQISIKDEKFPINWSFFEALPRNVLEFILDAVFSNQKIILFGINQEDIIPELISILPQSLKQISYSNVAADPNQQLRYDMMQVKGDRKTTDNDYVSIDVDELPPFYKNDGDLVLERSVKIFAEILKTKNIESLEFIHQEFDEIKDSSAKNKLKLTAYYEQIRNDDDEDKCTKFANDILKLLDDFNVETIIKYLLRIKKFLHENDYKKYSEQIEIDHIYSKFKDKPLNFENIRQMFHTLNDWSFESRDKLFSYVIKNDLEKVKENGAQLLTDSQYPDEDVIVTNFLKNESLHPCVLEIFTDKIVLADIYKQNKFRIIIIKSVKSQINLTTKLLKTPVFNLHDEYDSRNYRQILKIIFQDENLADKISTELLLDVISKNYSDIMQVVTHTPSSGTSGTTNSNLGELRQMIGIFLESLEYVLNNKEIAADIRNKINAQKEKLQEFLKTHTIKSWSISRLWE